MKTVSDRRPTRKIINLENIKENVALLKREGVKTFAVIKADAYGHGATAVSQYIKNDVDGFCVSNLSEAIDLRDDEFENSKDEKYPILVLGIIPSDWLSLRAAIDKEITITVASLEWVKLIEVYHKAISKQQKKLKVHLKIDSGMGRLGFRDVKETNEAIKKLKYLGVLVEGAYTHFATAEDEDEKYFQRQLKNFKEHLEQLIERPEIIHISNSAAILWHTNDVFNAVRLGVAMYGINPSGKKRKIDIELLPALTLETEIVHVKTIEQGEKIGYGGHYIAPYDQVVATLPIGYADGWTRDLEGFYVLVQGIKCHIIGRISMDQMVIALPREYQYRNIFKIGQKVILIGKSKGGESSDWQSISVEDIAEYRNSISYEVCCLLNERIYREYVPRYDDSIRSQAIVQKVRQTARVQLTGQVSSEILSKLITNLVKTEARYNYPKSTLVSPNSSQKSHYQHQRDYYRKNLYPRKNRKQPIYLVKKSSNK